MEGENGTLRCFKSNQIENKYGENENTTIHNLNDRLDFGLRLKCAFSHFNFGLKKSSGLLKWLIFRLFNVQ